MTDLDLIRALEQRCFNAWPTLRTLHVDGWVLRLADGHTRRANSASALYPSYLNAKALAGIVKKQFQASGLQPVIRVTPLAGAGISAGLAAQGWRDDDPSYGFYAADIVTKNLEPDALVEAKASEDWLEGSMTAYGHGAFGANALRKTLANLILPAAFITLHQNGKAVAWGLAVYERGMVGLYDLVIAPEVRGQGFGRKIAQDMMSWGQQQGATTAYLQVRVSNVAAQALYKSLGFSQVYEYTHYILD